MSVLGKVQSTYEKIANFFEEEQPALTLRIQPRDNIHLDFEQVRNLLEEQDADYDAAFLDYNNLDHNEIDDQIFYGVSEFMDIKLYCNPEEGKEVVNNLREDYIVRTQTGSSVTQFKPLKPFQSLNY